MDEQQARSWLSGPRYERFLVAAEGDHPRAVTLYEWHAEVTEILTGEGDTACRYLLDTCGRPPV